MTSHNFSSADPTVAWAERISYLGSLSREQYAVLVIKDVRLALSQIPEDQRRRSLILQLLEARLAKGNVEQIVRLWQKPQLGEFQNLRDILKNYDAAFYLKAKLLAYRIALEKCVKTSGT